VSVLSYIVFVVFLWIFLLIFNMSLLKVIRRLVWIMVAKHKLKKIMRNGLTEKFELFLQEEGWRKIVDGNTRTYTKGDSRLSITETKRPF